VHLSEGHGDLTKASNFAEAKRAKRESTEVCIVGGIFRIFYCTISTSMALILAVPKLVICRDDVAYGFGPKRPHLCRVPEALVCAECMTHILQMCAFSFIKHELAEMARGAFLCHSGVLQQQVKKSIALKRMGATFVAVTIVHCADSLCSKSSNSEL
jgi:hypothetical protein